MTPASSSVPVVLQRLSEVALSASCLKRSLASSSVGRPTLLYMDGPPNPPGSGSPDTG
jgi:hypothetical protein